VCVPFGRIHLSVCGIESGSWAVSISVEIIIRGQGLIEKMPAVERLGPTSNPQGEDHMMQARNIKEDGEPWSMPAGTAKTRIGRLLGHGRRLGDAFPLE
jgi:hypothetical protein